MNILGLFHALSPEAVETMDSDLKEAKASCQRQHGILVELRNDMKQLGADKDNLIKQLGESIMEAATKDQQLGGSIEYGSELQQKLSDATRRADDLKASREGLVLRVNTQQEEIDQHVRREATLKGQITKLKKKLEAR